MADIVLCSGSSHYSPAAVISMLTHRQLKIFLASAERNLRPFQAQSMWTTATALFDEAAKTTAKLC